MFPIFKKNFKITAYAVYYNKNKCLEIEEMSEILI